MELNALQNRYFDTKFNRGVSIPPLGINTAQGGDRFLPNQYGAVYKKYLDPFIETQAVYLEIGILSGVGLAVIDDYLVDAEVYGLDIYLENYKQNYKNLKARGAFKKQDPFVYEFDSYNPNKSLTNELFTNKKINILVDDGHHTLESMSSALEHFLPYLDKSNFVYFAEDCGRINIQAVTERLGLMFENVGSIDYYDKNIVVVKNL